MNYGDYDISDIISSLVKREYGHSDWKFENNGIIVYLKPRTCHLVMEHTDCDCGNEHDNKQDSFLVCGCGDCVKSMIDTGKPMRIMRRIDKTMAYKRGLIRYWDLDKHDPYNKLTIEGVLQMTQSDVNQL
tara:strand:+ start:1029 stop:1418 length:390 start_codon:yes stop_codon:yes gene_type:complete